MLTRRAKAYSSSCSKLSVYFQPFRRSSFFECALQPKIAKINKINPYYRSSGLSKSSMLIRLKSSSLELVVIGSMPLPICNRFHERLANNGIITTFAGVPLFDALVRRFPWTQKIETWTVEIYVQCWKFHMQFVHIYLNWFRWNKLLKCV